MRLDAGRVCEVVEFVDGRPAKLAQVVECLWDDDSAALASRAADTLERVTRDSPAKAQRWTGPLIGLLAETHREKAAGPRSDHTAAQADRGGVPSRRGGAPVGP